MSFKIFYDYLKENNYNFKLINLPIRNHPGSNPPGKVNHVKTILTFIKAISFLPTVSSVVVFTSSNFGFIYGSLLAVFSRLAGRCCYIRFFGGHPVTSFKFQNNFFMILMMNFLIAANKIVVETHVGASEFPEKIREKIDVVPGYRAASIHSISHHAHTEHNIFRFIYAGGITEEKGIQYLLKAYEKLCREYKGGKKIELHFYGAGRQDLIESIKLSQQCIYHGNIDSSLLQRELSNYDVFVFPSICKSEGHPGALIEALIAGLPVIATDLSGPSEIIKNNINGLLVRQRDIISLSDTMKTVVNNIELQNRLAQGALASSHAFNTENVLPKLARSLGIEVLA